MSKSVLESDILKPRDPALDDNTDEWPEFALSNVHVHLPGDPDATTSLLEASVGYPLTVTGQLEPLDEEDAHLYLQQPTKKRFNVVLEKVYLFAYGQNPDGIWAAGKSGWYRLKPSRSYQPIYDAMLEGVNLLYFIADAYREPRKKGKGSSATILPDYSVKEIYEKYADEELGSTDPAEGQAMIYAHKEFLIMCMLSGKEGLAWSKYPLYKHLKKQFPEITAEIRRRLSRPIPNESQPTRSKGAKAKQIRQGSVDTTASTGSSKRKRGQASRAVEVITIDSDTEDSEAIKDSLLQAAEREKRSANAREAPNRTRSTRQHAIEEPVEDEVATPMKDEETDEETRLRSRKNKSSLRPKASKASKSSARKGGKGPAGGEQETDDGETLSSPIAGKRKYDDRAEFRQPSKRRSSKTHVDEGIDIPTSPSASGDAEDDSSSEAQAGTTSDLPLRELGHVPDPVQEDTWICALDGCAHKVYAASQPESQRLIKAHYELHAFDDDERVQLVKKLQAPSLQAQHLLERVKQQAKIEAFPGSRQMASRYPPTMPAPVAQKY